jgi:hypothetical protein
MNADKWQIYNRLKRKKHAYARLFFGPDGKLKPDAELILADLRRYARRSGIIGYRTTSGAVDPLAMANANGRREMYDRIMRFLHLPDDVEVQLESRSEE